MKMKEKGLFNSAFTFTERSSDEVECNDGEMLTSNSQGFRSESNKTSKPKSSKQE